MALKFSPLEEATAERGGGFLVPLARVVQPGRETHPLAPSRDREGEVVFIFFFRLRRA
jgi:hypothetical protein